MDHKVDIIGRLRDEGLTQAKIGERIGWSREVVKHHISVLDNVGTNILNLAKANQVGRVPNNGTNVPAFNFTEGWLRNSGLYDLEEKYQSQVFNSFIGQTGQNGLPGVVISVKPRKMRV